MRTTVRTSAALLLCVSLTPCALGQKSHQYDYDAPIAIPAAGTSGNASAYPASVTVAGLTAPVGEVKVVLRGLTHTYMTDLDILLVGPGGQTAVLLSRVGGFNPGPMNATYVIAQGANIISIGALAPDGRYTPSGNPSVPPAFGAPAPAGPYGSSLDVFKGLSGNGTWSLYIVDQASSDVGSLAGWSLILSETSSSANERPITIPAGAPGTTAGPASPYPSTAIVDGLEGTVRSVQVMVSGISHSFERDLRMLIQGPGGQAVLLYGNCGNSTGLSNGDFVFDDNAAIAMPPTEVPVPPGTYRPTVCNFYYTLATQNLPAPAPAAPYGTTLSLFNGTAPNGAWKLWIQDTNGGDTGFVARGFAVIVNGQACPSDFNKSGATDVQDIFDFLNGWFAGCP